MALAHLTHKSHRLTCCPDNESSRASVQIQIQIQIQILLQIQIQMMIAKHTTLHSVHSKFATINEEHR